MRKLVIISIIAVFVCMGLVMGAWAQETIKVGFVCNLTGPASSWGQYHARGHMDYFRYVNEVKGGVAGKKIELTMVDHAYKVPEGVKYVK
ncbi:MAG: ABC transporter substrate-binding protein, partial [Deltaproteobacteria bacterium]|nr:ABC transporter substrate-binding protein [Deltaproteobacteria bacterium]